MTQDVIETDRGSIAVETAAPGQEWTTRGGWILRWQIPLFLVSLLAWVTFLALQHHEEIREVEDPRDAARAILRAFREGRYEAVRTDGRVFGEVYHGHAMAGEVALAAGRASFKLAETLPDRAPELYLETVEHLKRALTEMLEDDDLLLANETLAGTFMRLEEYASALDVFVSLEEKFPEKANVWLLSRARAEFQLGKTDAAEASVERFRGADDISEDRTVDALLELAQGYGVVKRLDKAEELFRRVVADFPYSGRIGEAHFGLGLVLMEKSGGKGTLLDEAIGHFESVAKGGVIREDLNRKAAYFIGDCLYAKEDYERAAAELRKIAVMYGGTPEGIAAGLRVAAILVAEKEFGAAREALARVLTQVPDGERLVNKYVSEAEINSIWRAVLKHYLSEGEYEKLQELNRETAKVAGDDIYLYQQASLYRHRGAELREEADKLRAQQLFKPAARREMEARTAYREAGRLLVRIINETKSDRQLHTRALQRAADSLAQSGEYAQAVVYYRMFLSGARDRQSIQWTYIRYARALQALGRHKDAVDMLTVWLASDKEKDTRVGSPVRAEATFVIAESHVALRELDIAEEMLRRIVDHNRIFQPKARLWRRALGELAYVLYLRGKFPEAVTRFDEMLKRKGVVAASRFTPAEVTYYLADAYRNIRSEEPAARKLELQRAAGHFGEVRTAVRDEREASPLVLRMIRRSTVAEADCRFELGEYAAALRVYEFAAEKYLEDTQGVGALFAAAACLHRLGETERALKTADRARWGLSQLKKTKPKAVTKFMEEAWTAMILWSKAEADL